MVSFQALALLCHIEQLTGTCGSLAMKTFDEPNIHYFKNSDMPATLAVANPCCQGTQGGSIELPIYDIGVKIVTTPVTIISTATRDLLPPPCGTRLGLSTFLSHNPTGSMMHSVLESLP